MSASLVGSEMCIRDSRVTGSSGRTPLTRLAALQAARRVAMLLEHGLGDVDAPRSTLNLQTRRRRRGLLRDARDHLWLAA
eukprot:9113902-Alexandrium_andersonii.AAC.1